jgi:hypothetical protein
MLGTTDALVLNSSPGVNGRIHGVWFAPDVDCLNVPPDIPVVNVHSGSLLDEDHCPAIPFSLLQRCRHHG